MKLIVLKSAVTDIKEINKYLCEFGQQPARKFRQSVEKFREQVVNTPYMYPEYAPLPEYRRAILEYGYLLFYKVDEEIDRIKIYRVLHGKQQPSLHLHLS